VRAKYRGLSTARRTVKLSTASVEMTCLFMGGSHAKLFVAMGFSVNLFAVMGAYTKLVGGDEGSMQEGAFPGEDALVMRGCGEPPVRPGWP
jgi:hypothetical protein